MSNSPHDNPHWEKQRDERDIERLLQGKPVAENSNFRMTRASNVYILIFKLLIYQPVIRGALWRGFWDRLFNRNQKSEPSNGPTDPDDFPF